MSKVKPPNAVYKFADGREIRAHTSMSCLEIKAAYVKQFHSPPPEIVDETCFAPQRPDDEEDEEDDE